VEAQLGGQWRAGCFIVERRWDRSSRHGSEEVGDVAKRFDRASNEAVLFAGGAPVRPPFVFFDLETTGLSGGAGTHVFLVGFGWFAEEAFVTRQLLLTRFADERALLETVSNAIGSAGALVSFNGKAFDAPLLETRYLFHRQEWVGGRLPHVDVLHPARQFWKSCDSCSLTSLEEQVLGHRRARDVSGFEIPARYFHFVRTGDARPLVAVFEHNRLDLLSLAALTARLLHLAHCGPAAARDAREALALGRIYFRAGFASRACEAFEEALHRSGAPSAAAALGWERSGAPSAAAALGWERSGWERSGDVRVEALHALALAFRRIGRFGQAADCWRRLLDTPSCPDRVAREAIEALAIHHEHRVRDLAAARAFALKGLERAELEKRPAWSEAVRYRLARIERKMGPRLNEPPQASLFSLWPPSSGSQTSAHRTFS
jgi:uncharacterized protein YprB with RNaseH-like and TPR domain